MNIGNFISLLTTKYEISIGQFNLSTNVFYLMLKIGNVEYGVLYNENLETLLQEAVKKYM